jgi:hypothetical protein
MKGPVTNILILGIVGSLRRGLGLFAVYLGFQPKQM